MSRTARGVRSDPAPARGERAERRSDLLDHAEPDRDQRRRLRKAARIAAGSDSDLKTKLARPTLRSCCRLQAPHDRLYASRRLRMTRLSATNPAVRAVKIAASVNWNRQ